MPVKLLHKIYGPKVMSPREDNSSLQAFVWLLKVLGEITAWFTGASLNSLASNC